MFAQFGYAGTSITMIAQACGVSKALLYHYYADKQAVLFDTIRAHLERLVAVVDGASQHAPGAEQRVHAIAAALLDAYRDADAEHQVQLSSLKLLPQDRQEALRDLVRVRVARLSEALAAALPRIGHGPALKPLTMSLFGILNWHYLWFRDGKAMSREQYAHFVTTLILTGAEAAAGAMR